LRKNESCPFHICCIFSQLDSGLKILVAMKTSSHVIYSSNYSFEDNTPITVSSIGMRIPTIHLYPHQACQASQRSERLLRPTGPSSSFMILPSRPCEARETNFEYVERRCAGQDALRRVYRQSSADQNIVISR
jgi:hypothetical protein